MASAETGTPVVSPPLPHRDRKAGGVVVLLAFFTLNFADKAAMALASQQIRHDLGLSAGDFGLVGSVPTGSGVLRGWLELPGGENFDPISLLYAVDSFPPAT